MAKIKSLIPKDARSLAVHVLQQMSATLPLQSALDTAFMKFPLDHKEKSLCTELVYGYTRYAIRIDFILDTLLKKRVDLPKALQFTLGISAYALLFLNRVPHYATVNWAVSFTKKQFGMGLSKLCNGVLRSLIRLDDAPMHRDFFSSAHEFYSTPKWIYDLWLDAYGEKITHTLLLRTLQRPRLCLRLNKLHADYTMLKAFLSSHEGAHAIGFDGFVFDEALLPKFIFDQSMSELHNAGAFSWQAAGSQEALAKCFEAVPDLYKQSFWDACAGQGGKSFALMEQGIEVELISDVSKSRMRQLVITAERLKLELPLSTLMSATNPSIKFFDGSILLDVPCSGLGTLAKRPDIRLHRTYADMQEMLILQREICQGAWSLLRADAYLIYMTCTLNPQENENQIDAFLQNNANAKLIFSWQTPHEHPYLEGMFVAIIQKN